MNCRAGGKGTQINTKRTEFVTTRALTILQRSLMPTYLHVILYILNPEKEISLIKIKYGNAVINILLYSRGSLNSKRRKKERKRERVIIKISKKKKKINLLK
jgi:hypothetical protein